MGPRPYSRRRALAILGLRSDASFEEVKYRFRTLALRCHPDHNKSDRAKTERFIRVRQAYEAIINDAESLTSSRRQAAKTAVTFLGYVVEQTKSDRNPYVLHGPRGRLLILVRHHRLRTVLEAVDNKGHRRAIHWRGQQIWFLTDRDDKLRIWDFK